MRRPPPGVRLHAVLLRWAPVTVVRDVAEPAIADLQYEAEHAPTVRERRSAIVRGYRAIARALVVSLLLSIEPAGTIRVALALSALGAVGTVLFTIALAAHVDARILNSAILAPGMLAPGVLRLLGTTSSSRLFVGSLVVAMLAPAFAGDFGRAVALLVLFAPIAAAAAIVAGPTRETSPKRAVTALSYGSGIAAAFLIARSPQGHLSIGLAMTPFYVTLFAALFGLTVLPFLLVARAFIARPVLLAIAGLICSPVPLIAAAYLDHRTLTACLVALRQTPLAFAASSLPFVIGASAVGWRFPPCPRDL